MKTNNGCTIIILNTLYTVQIVLITLKVLNLVEYMWWIAFWPTYIIVAIAILWMADEL